MTTTETDGTSAVHRAVLNDARDNAFETLRHRRALLVQVPNPLLCPATTGEPEHRRLLRSEAKMPTARRLRSEHADRTSEMHDFINKTRHSVKGSRREVSWESREWLDATLRARLGVVLDGGAPSH